MDTQVTSLHLEQFPLFEGLPSQLLERLVSVATLKIRQSSTYVYEPSSRADHVYLLRTGQIKIGNYGEDSKEILKSIIRPGGIFGELAITGDSNRNEYALVSRLESEYISFRVADFRHAMTENPDFAFRVLQVISDKMRDTEMRLESFLFQDSRSRIIEYILSQSAQFGVKSGNDVMFYHYLTHQDMANLTGTSRQFVTGVLNALRRSGLIGFNRSTLTVKNRAGLKGLISSGKAERA